jgi:hypothetical protein
MDIYIDIHVHMNVDVIAVAQASTGVQRMVV